MFLLGKFYSDLKDVKIVKKTVLLFLILNAFVNNVISQHVHLYNQLILNNKENVTTVSGLRLDCLL